MINDLDFDCPFVVGDDGSITPTPYGLHLAPTVVDDECDSSRWELLSGWTMQWSYNGPTMHPSEYLGGALERYVLETPGTYVLVESYSTDAIGEHGAQVIDDWPVDVVGWCIARLIVAPQS